MAARMAAERSTRSGSGSTVDGIADGAAARCRTSGEVTGDSSGTAGCATVTATGGAAGAAVAAAASVPDSSAIVASTAPTGTRCPGWTTSRSTTPLAKHSTSTAALAVSTTATTSPLWTVAPGWTSHSRSTPSSMSAPSEGIRNSAMSGHQLPDGGGDPGRLRQCRVFEVLGVRDRYLGRADPGHRSVEVVEGLLGDAGADLGGEAARAPALVDQERAVGTAYRVK